MTKPTICDRCHGRIDNKYTGAPVTVKNSTGTGETRGTIHICASCHADVRDSLDRLLLPNGPYEHTHECGDAAEADQ